MTIVYFPVAHWVFDFGDKDGNGAGWLAARGVLDFAGGTAVHVNAGAAGLALALVLGKRIGWKKDPMRPHNLTLVMLGAGLLWFGWFGFNAGSALGANALAGQAFFTTMIATATAMLGWLFVERFRDGHYTSLGAASGAVAGLVAITPACAFVTPVGAIVLGLLAGAVCALAVGLKWQARLRRLARRRRRPPGRRCLRGALARLPRRRDAGRGTLLRWRTSSLLGKQALAVVAVRRLLVRARLRHRQGTRPDVGFRIPEEDEVEGIDLFAHAETGYDIHFGGTGSGALTGQARRTRPDRRGSKGSERMKLVTAVIKPHKWDEVREALETFGVTGMTVSRGQRLRPAEGPHRGLPRRGVRHRAGPEDPDRDRGRRR